MTKTQNPHPKPTRTWRRNIWGNVVGYEGRSRAEEFGCHTWSERWAMAWCQGMSRENAETFAIFNSDFDDRTHERT